MQYACSRHISDCSLRCVLIAYLQKSKLSLEAGIKYLVLAASLAAFLLFGMALIYAEAGTMSFAQIAARVAAQPNTSLAVSLPGTALRHSAWFENAL